MIQTSSQSSLLHTNINIRTILRVFSLIVLHFKWKQTGAIISQGGGGRFDQSTLVTIRSRTDRPGQTV